MLGGMRKPSWSPCFGGSPWCFTNLFDAIWHYPPAWECGRCDFGQRFIMHSSTKTIKLNQSIRPRHVIFFRLRPDQVSTGTPTPFTGLQHFLSSLFCVTFIDISLNIAYTFISMDVNYIRSSNALSSLANPHHIQSFKLLLSILVFIIHVKYVACGVMIYMVNNNIWGVEILNH